MGLDEVILGRGKVTGWVPHEERSLGLEGVVMAEAGLRSLFLL